MEKTKEIHKALKRRGYINSEMIGLKNHIERLSKLLKNFENERKVLDFELHSWDIFSNKTNSISNNLSNKNKNGRRINMALSEKDLRIGNLVKWYDVSKVLELHSEKNKFDNVYIECEESFEWTEYNKLEPIPLTEEWLLKFRFEKSKRFELGELKPCYVIFSLAVMIRHNSFFVDWIGGNTELKYVHQLQNLYFALTGTELTVA